MQVEKRVRKKLLQNTLDVDMEGPVAVEGG